MERFTYAKTGAALRTKVQTMLVLASSDFIIWPGISLLLRRPWNWVVLGAGLLLTAWLFWFLSSQLRKFHLLHADALELAFGRHTLRIDRADIKEAVPFKGPLPRDVDPASLSYKSQTDTLYLLADRRGLVALELRRPYETKVPHMGICQFTRAVLSLDEPQRFLEALQASPTPAPTPAERAPVPAVPTISTRPTPEPGEAAIRLKQLVRRYGDLTAVRSIDLAVQPGEVLAFLGSNGAGKTTTIKMMTGLLRPTSGQVLIEGRDLWAGGGAVRRLVGYVPDVPLLYEGLTAREFLWFMAGLYDLPEAHGRKAAEAMLALMKLERWGDQQLCSFSLGMKRKMAIAAALIHQPRVLLLDEVTNGLDPRAAREVKDLIADAARAGTAVFLTTHILDVAEELAHRIAVIHAGEIRALGSLAELRAQAGMEGATLEELFLALTGERRAQEVGA